jgi:hypothetical protein
LAEAKAVAAGKASLNPSEQAERDRIIGLALISLRQAVDAGFKDWTSLYKNREFDVLYLRPDYHELISRMRYPK